MAHYRGVVRVNGTPHELQVEGSPAGRTVVREGDQVLLSEKPFVAKEEFAFRIGPKSVTLKWVQVGFGYECHILADDRVVLSTIDSAGVTKPPLSAGEKQRKNTRFAAAGLAAAGVVCLVLNSGVKTGDRYYPTLLAMAPLLIIVAIVLAIAPDTFAKLRNGGSQTVIAIVLLLIFAVASRILFVPFYLSLFS
jgi:hypothetical protein